MVPRAQEHPRDPRPLQAVEEGLVVRHHDRAHREAEVQQRVVCGAVSFDGAVLLREAQARSRGPIPLRKGPQLLEDRRGDGDVDVPQETTELRLQVDAELERHHERVRVEEGGPGQRFRASAVGYMGLEAKRCRCI